MTTPGGARRPTARREGKGRTIAPSPGGADSISDEPPVSPDITPLQQAQAGLSRYQLLADNAREILLCLDQAGRVLEANAAAVAAYGYTRAELLGLSLADLLPPDASPTLVEQLAQAPALASCLRQCTAAGTAPPSRWRSARACVTSTAGPCW